MQEIFLIKNIKMSLESNSKQKKKFNKKTYIQYVNYFKKIGYKFVNYKKFKNNKCILLRHDVDFSIDLAKEIATWDKQLKIKSHFFFLYDSQFYNIFEDKNIESIKFIKKLGHSVGFHINAKKNSKLIKKEMDLLFQIFLIQDCKLDKIYSVHKYGSNRRRILIKGYKNFYSNPLFNLYYADSGGQFRYGNPLANKNIILKKISFQINLHPIWWVFNQSKKDKIKKIKNIMLNNFNKEIKSFKLI